MYEGMIAETVGFEGHNGDVIDGYLARPLGVEPDGRSSFGGKLLRALYHLG